MKAALVWLRDHPTVALVLLAVVLAGVAARGCNRAGEAEARASAAEEREKARKAGVLVVDPVVDLQPQLEAAVKDNAELVGELDRVRQAVGRLKALLVIQAKTAGGPVSGPERPGEAAPDVPCLLAVGDQLRLDVDLAIVEGPGGAHMAVGTAAAVRVADEVLLLRQPFSAPVTIAAERAEEPSTTSRWGIAPLFGVARGGWAVGGLAQSPSFQVPIVHWDVSAVAVGAAGPEAWMLVGGPLFRF